MKLPRTFGNDGESLVPGARNVVAVASAKGGVGKSTVCMNLAMSMARRGLRVGLLDGDIYGPSVQLMAGVREQPELTNEDRLLPVEAGGVCMMSMGFLADESTPVVWRGPLLAQAVQQFLKQVEWGDLDILLIDMPPGTGDIALTLSQVIALSGVVIVTTPQDVALEDVERGVAMFEKVEVDVLGLVENMSYYVCPHCDERHEIFGNSGGRALATGLGIEFFGELPLHGSIRQGGDEGRPVAAFPQNEQSALFDGIVDKLAHALEQVAIR